MAAESSGGTADSGNLSFEIVKIGFRHQQLQLHTSPITSLDNFHTPLTAHLLNNGQQIIIEDKRAAQQRLPGSALDKAQSLLN